MMSTSRWVLASCLLFCGCATEAVHVRVLRPAPVNLVQYDRVAVDLFDGGGGTEIAGELTDALATTRNPLTGQQAFEVLDRREVDRMIDDLRRRRGQSDTEAMEVLARWREAPILIRGRVETHGVEEVVTQNKKIDERGVPHMLFTRTCTAEVHVTIEVCEGQGERLFDRAVLRERTSASTAGLDTPPAPIDQMSLLAAARRKVVDQYMRRVLPHEDVVAVQLYDDRDYAELQVGNGYARTGEWERALESYRSALARMTGEAAQDRHLALYNIGVALEYTNRFEEARQALQEAYGVEQDKKILAEIANVARREAEYAQLAEQRGPATTSPSTTPPTTAPPTTTPPTTTPPTTTQPSAAPRPAQPAPIGPPMPLR